MVCNATVYIKNLDRGIIKEYKTSCDDPGFYEALFAINNETGKKEFEIGERLCVEAFKGSLYGKVVTKFTPTDTGYRLINITILPNTVQAFATGPAGVSSDRNITITYSYNGFPDYVSIYYS
ncbi:MAG: hypothetical protein FE045_00825, partial [Thermoplasmata archaeon]